MPPVTFSYTVSDGTPPLASTVAVDVTQVNDAPTAVVFGNVHGPIRRERVDRGPHQDRRHRGRDVDGGANNLSLSGLDASLFEIIGTTLWLKAGAHLDFETNPLLNVTVNVNDAGGRRCGRCAGLAIDRHRRRDRERSMARPSANTLNGANYGEIYQRAWPATTASWAMAATIASSAGSAPTS